MDYSQLDAAAYATSREKLTYQLGLNAAMELMCFLQGAVVLDFGAGTGSSARALLSRGASRVIAIDNNENMIRAAFRDPRITYILGDHRLPIRTNSLSAAFCGNVFPEFDNIMAITDSCTEIRRVLRPGGRFVVQTLNPDSIGCDYLSFRYLPVDWPVSGSPLTCLIKAEPPIHVRDYFWTVDDYQSALRAAGFKINRIVFPTANENTPESPWLDETRIAPDVLFECS